MTRRAAGWLAAAVVALLTAWLVAPAAVPIYDGIGNPDEPYRYVQPPQSAKTAKAPTTAKAVAAVRNGVNQPQFANSGESGPQISVFAPAGAFRAPAGVTGITMTAVPMAPKPPLPTDGTIVTNVYHVTATAKGQPVPIVGTGHRAPSMQMRAPTGKQPGPVFERRTSSGWQQLKTLRIGVDIYQASGLTSFGDFALVQLTHPPGSGGGGGVNAGLLAGGIALLVVTGGILVIRSRRTRARAP